uniref:Uncharacterized protein n=1 Tax=Rhizophora mucronata TaxID=61149 RepID=A0A2P2KBU7_RHIMU
MFIVFCRFVFPFILVKLVLHVIYTALAREFLIFSLE